MTTLVKQTEPKKADKEKLIADKKLFDSLIKKASTPVQSDDEK